jgi:hypothetical protein
MFLSSVLDAIKAGRRDFEPADTRGDAFQATTALPGSDEKLEVLARRVERGLPLWHPEDRRTFDDTEGPV